MQLHVDERRVGANAFRCGERLRAVRCLRDDDVAGRLQESARQDTEAGVVVDDHAQLVVTVGAVERHVTSIFDELGLR